MIPDFSPFRTHSRRSLVAAALTASLFGVRMRPAQGQAEPDVTDVLSSASQRLADIESLHFTLAIDGDTYIDESGAIQLQGAKGDLARPDKVAVEFQVRLLGATTVSIRMITIGTDSWTTDLITGNWGDAPPEFGYNPSILYDDQDGLGPVMGKLESADLASIEDIEDREAYHVTGTATSEIIAPLTAGTMTGDEVAVELWIDVETSDLLRVKVIEPESEAKENPATWEMNLSAFNEMVTIEPPE